MRGSISWYTFRKSHGVDRRVSRWHFVECASAAEARPPERATPVIPLAADATRHDHAILATAVIIRLAAVPTCIVGIGLCVARKRVEKLVSRL